MTKSFWSQLVTVLCPKHELVSEPAWVSVLPKLSCELRRNLLWIITSWPLLLPGRISSPLSRGAWQVGLPYRWILVLNAFGSVQDRSETSGTGKHRQLNRNPGKADVRSLRYFCLEGRIWWLLKVEGKDENIKSKDWVPMWTRKRFWSFTFLCAPWSSGILGNAILHPGLVQHHSVVWRGSWLGAERERAAKKAHPFKKYNVQCAWLVWSSLTNLFVQFWSMKVVQEALVRYSIFPGIWLEHQQWAKLGHVWVLIPSPGSDYSTCLWPSAPSLYLSLFSAVCSLQLLQRVLLLLSVQ